MHGLAKLKLYKNDTNQRIILKANVYSSDEEYCEKTGSKDAPYIEQYYYKKRLDDMLEEDHYWSDATDKNDATYTEEVILFTSTNDQRVLYLTIIIGLKEFWTIISKCVH